MIIIKLKGCNNKLQKNKDKIYKTNSAPISKESNYDNNNTTNSANTPIVF